MKNRLINKNNNIFEKKKKKKGSLQDFSDSNSTNKNPVKITLKHYFYIVEAYI